MTNSIFAHLYGFCCAYYAAALALLLTGPLLTTCSIFRPVQLFLPKEVSGAEPRKKSTRCLRAHVCMRQERRLLQTRTLFVFWTCRVITKAPIKSHPLSPQ